MATSPALASADLEAGPADPVDQDNNDDDARDEVSILPTILTMTLFSDGSSLLCRFYLITFIILNYFMTAVFYVDSI